MSEVIVRASVVSLVLASLQFCVFRADDGNGVRQRFVARDLPRLPVIGETWHITGAVEIHPLHGPQVAVETMSLARPEGHLLARLLAGQHFPGVGEATANKLWGAFGEQLVNVLDSGDAASLLGLLGDDARSRSQVETILTEWPVVAAEPHLLAGLDRIGVPQKIATKLLLIYGVEALDRLYEDPYRLLAFTGWATADRIANLIGVLDDDVRRITAACEAALHERLVHQGDTLMPEVEVKLAVERLLRRHVDKRDLEVARRHGAIHKRETGWQAAGAALMEEAIAMRIASDLVTPAEPPSGLPLVDHDNDSVTLNADQAVAVTMAITNNFSLLVGGAGTGKTTALKAICRAARNAGIPVELMALSGRAALRMREATGEMARTIAGWLIGVTAGHIDLSTRPLIIIDEASMVDLGSLYRVIRAAPEGCRFLLVGDDGQILPVGFGLTFHALLEVEAIPRTVLTEIMRQAAATGIPAAARAIRDGDMPDVPAYDEHLEAGVTIAACNEQDVVKTAVAIRRAIPGAQIVGSIKGNGNPSDGGTIAMNAALHSAWATAKVLDPVKWLRGEPVIWTVNDYDLNLWNGSLGKITDMTAEGLAVRFDEGDRVIPKELLQHLELAWAITTHKAQGSQFDVVIVPVTRSRILDRALLYTALTRARHRVVLVGEPEVIQAVVQQPPQASRRMTHLAALVHKRVRETSGHSSGPGVLLPGQVTIRGEITPRHHVSGTV